MSILKNVKHNNERFLGAGADILADENSVYSCGMNQRIKLVHYRS